MSLDISLVPPELIDGIEPKVIDKLDTVAALTNGRYEGIDILNSVRAGQMQLWIIFDPATLEIFSTITTELKIYPRCKLLCIQYCTGDPFKTSSVWDRMTQTLERFAAAEGCIGVEFSGRPGWGKHFELHDYRKIPRASYEKFFEE